MSLDEYVKGPNQYRETVRFLMMLDAHSEKQNITFRRVAYVCKGGEIKYTHDLGFSTLTAAFISRPSNCQYCVMVDSKGNALLIDMLDLTNIPTNILTYKEDSTHVFSTVDAAIMYAISTE